MTCFIILAIDDVTGLIMSKISQPKKKNEVDANKKKSLIFGVSKYFLMSKDLYYFVFLSSEIC